MPDRTPPLGEKNTSDGIMSEVQRAEDILKDSLHRVDGIERELRTKLLTLENRERLVRELEDVKEVLTKSEELLRGLIETASINELPINNT